MLCDGVNFNALVWQKGGMSAPTDSGREYTTLSVHRRVVDRLTALKPYESMSYNDLLTDMIEDYSDQDQYERS